ERERERERDYICFLLQETGIGLSTSTIPKCWCLVGKQENGRSLMHPTFLVDCSSGRKQLLNTPPGSKTYRHPLSPFSSRSRMETYMIFCCDVSISAHQIVQSKGSKEMSCILARVSTSSQPCTVASVEASESFRSKASVPKCQQSLRNYAKSNAVVWGADSRSPQHSAWYTVKRFLKSLAVCVFGRAD
uniref:Uncharacterized protein n=1 Tax=Pelusios castaneus TaxID=367368 RepID=A0A8C8RMN0_9SAUR